MSERKKYTFEEHDQLDRQKFASFLLHLMNKRNDYRRDPDDTGSYSIAIDGTYGSGKTRFLQMFQSYLQEVNAGYSVLYYNAWEHDIFQDALSSFVYQISHDDMFIDAQEDEELEEKKKSLQKVAKITLNAIVAVGTKKVFGGAGEEVVEQIRDAISGKINDDPAPTPYEVRRDAFNKLTEALAQYTSTYPLLFIIDELDRCSPDFAVQTFEIAKHLISVPNAVFLFTVDMRQMLAAVHKVYGENMDAEGYICKVFDYIAILPQHSKVAYITTILDSWDEPALTGCPELVRHIINTMNRPTCSLRTINTVLQAFHIMWNTFLREYHNLQAYCLYFSCLYLKYQNIGLYNLLSFPTEIDSGREEAIKEICIGPDTVITLLRAHNKNIGEDLTIRTYISIGESVILPITSTRPNPDHTLDLIASDPFGSTYRETLPLHASFNPLLYANDLLHFKDIKDLTYGQYIHRQLEMFNFSQPEGTDNPQQ